MKNTLSIKQELNEFLLYTAPDGEIKVEVFFANENIWLTQKRMADLFGVDVRTINEHLKNIYLSGELQRDSTIRKFRIVQNEGMRKVSRRIEFYNLDAIISVGYRVNSSQATRFRIWATERLKEYIIKGFAMDDDRLSNGRYFGKDYFKELLERIRSIRSSERRIYLQITDIFQECSIDYNPNSRITKDFFATIQNKFHYAITGQTAAEIIHSNADKKKPYMGLTTWKDSPKGRILKSDIVVAKNYLSEKEIRKLERAVSGFFDYIENVIESKKTLTMVQFAKSVDKFLEFNEYKILDGKGSISMNIAQNKAISEYIKFNKTQKIESDFEKQLIKKLQDDLKTKIKSSKD
ncbi:virulence RhuM family protein [Candidatus Dojkabacteria bacterium]|nr:virulence RhuM family protein [Candidatus Dojkabacteria bacterium]